MQVDQAISSDNANGEHELDEEEAWLPVGPELIEEPQHIALANELSSYDEALGLPHRPIVSLGEDGGLASQTKERAKDGAPH